MIDINFLPFVVVILPIWAMYRVSVFFKNRKFNFQREIVTGMFFIYLLGVVYLTFFSFQVRIYGWNPSINLIPIKETISMIRNGSYAAAFINIAGNILLLSPIGIFLPVLFIKARSIKRVLRAGFFTSLFIEAIQLLSGLRICDIDDVIFNTIGTLIGYALYLVLKKASQKFASLEALVEDNTQGSLLARAVMPVSIVLLVTLSLCAVSIYQNPNPFSQHNKPGVYMNMAPVER